MQSSSIAHTIWMWMMYSSQQFLSDITRLTGFRYTKLQATLLLGTRQCFCFFFLSKAPVTPRTCYKSIHYPSWQPILTWINVLHCFMYTNCWSCRVGVQVAVLACRSWWEAWVQSYFRCLKLFSGIKASPVSQTFSVPNFSNRRLSAASYLFVVMTIIIFLHNAAGIGHLRNWATTWSVPCGTLLATTAPARLLKLKPTSFNLNFCVLLQIKLPTCTLAVRPVPWAARWMSCSKWCPSLVMIYWDFTAFADNQ